jgi:hypothetical protein
MHIGQFLSNFNSEGKKIPERKEKKKKKTRGSQKERRESRL